MDGGYALALIDGSVWYIIFNYLCQIKFYFKYFLNKCKQIDIYLWVCSILVKEPLKENLLNISFVNVNQFVYIHEKKSLKE